MARHGAEQMRAFFRMRVATLVPALRAAGRDTEADACARRARELDPSEEMVKALAGARVDRPR